MVLAPGQRRAGGNQRVHLNRSSGVWVADEIDRQRHAVLGLMPEESIRSLLAPELPDPATVRGITPRGLPGCERSGGLPSTSPVPPRDDEPPVGAGFTGL